MTEFLDKIAQPAADYIAAKAALAELEYYLTLLSPFVLFIGLVALSHAIIKTGGNE